jgi:predicted kinase
MLRRAGLLLELGESVILDASWGSAEHREAAGATATAASSDLRQLCCATPRDVAVQRVSARAGADHQVSDADAAVATALAVNQASWPAATLVDTRVAVAESVDTAVSLVRPVRLHEPRRPRSMMAPD